MIKSLFKDIIKYIPSKIIPAIVAFISIPIITRLFSPADYGDYILVLSTFTILTTLVGWISMSIIRFYPLYKKNKKIDIFYGTVLKCLFVSISGISILVLIILLASKNHISQNIYNLMWVGLGGFILLSIFQTLLNLLRAKRLVGWYSVFSSWQSIGVYIIGLGLILGLNFGIGGLLWGVILSISIIIPWIWKKALGKFFLFKNKFSFHLSRKMAIYSLPLVMGNLAAWLLSLSDRYVLNFFKGSQEVGIYSASYMIGEKSIILLTSLFLLASRPIVIKIWENEGKAKTQQFLNNITRYFLIICLPATIGLCILSKPIINILVAHEYIEGYQILSFIVFGGFFLGLSQRFNTVLCLYKKTKYIMWSLLMGGLINLVLNFIFIPKYGYIAAAVTTLIGYIVMLLAMIYFSRKFFTWKFPFKTLTKCTLASVTMGTGIYFLINALNFSTIINLIIVILFGVILYFSLIYLFKEIQPKEKKIIINFIKRKIVSKNVRTN